jgi:hypothetical protein
MKYAKGQATFHSSLIKNKSYIFVSKPNILKVSYHQENIVQLP